MTLSIANALSPMLRLTKSVDVVIITPCIDDLVGDGRGRPHRAPGRIAQHFRPVRRIEGVDIVVIAPDVDGSVESSGRGEHSTFGYVIPIQSALRRTVPWQRAVVAGTLHVVAEHGSLVRACGTIRRGHGTEDGNKEYNCDEEKQFKWADTINLTVIYQTGKDVR